MNSRRGFWKEYFIYGFNVTLSGSDGTSFTSNVIRLDADSDFEFHKVIFTATDNQIYVRYRDESIGRYLTKYEVDIRSIAGVALSGVSGNGFCPFVWPRPYLISAGSNFVVETSDFSGSSNTLRMAFHGAKIRPGVAPWDRKYRAVVPFTYGQRATVSGNATSSLRIEIDTDAHFLIQRITGTATSSSCLVDVKEGARDKDWSNTPIIFNNIIGNGQFPNILSANRFLNRGSVLVIQVQDLSGSSNVVEIDFEGVKLYE